MGRENIDKQNWPVFIIAEVLGTRASFTSLSVCVCLKISIMESLQN